MPDLATATDLAAALPCVLAAPSSNTVVHILCTRPAMNQPTFVQRTTPSREEGVSGDIEVSIPWLKQEDRSPAPGITVSCRSMF